jgi:hypothetical protein
MSSRRLIKATALLIVTLAVALLFNALFEQDFGGWSLSVAVGATMLVMWPAMNYFVGKGRFGLFFFKIDSKMGLKLIDGLGTRYSRFWTHVGDFAIVLLFGGIGAAFVAYHLKGRARAVLLSSLAFAASYIFLSQSILSIYPPSFFIQFSLIAFALSLLIGFAVFKFSGRLSKGHSSILAFALTFLVFASPFLLEFWMEGEVLSLISGIFVGVLGPPGYLILQFAVYGIVFALGASEMSAVYPALPAMEDGAPVLKDPGGLGISIPIFPDLLIAIVILLILHEGFHGLVARAQGIRVVHTGIATMSVMPLGAFVEPDEKQFKKETPIKQARVFAVGSFANIAVLALISILLASLILSQGWVFPEGIAIGTVIAGAPAAEFMQPGDTLYSLDSARISTLEEFYAVLGDTTAKQTVLIATNRGEFEAVLASHPQSPKAGFLGVAPRADRTMSIFAPELTYSKLSGGLALSLFILLKWMFIVNLSVGLFNLLPIPIFDGHGVYRNIFQWMESSSKWAKKKKLAKVLTNGLTFMIIAILLLNILPYLF